MLLNTRTNIQFSKATNEALKYKGNLEYVKKSGYKKDVKLYP